MKRLLLLFFFLLGLSPAHAQVAGMGVNGCGIPLTQLKVGIPAWLQVDTGTGSLCISGTISATTAGFSATQTGIAPLAVSNVTNTASFSSATSVVVTNVGTTNPMYCQPGAGPATTSAQLITAGGGWFNFYAAGGITQISCITASSTTTANIVGGTGLAAGTGGGAGGGGGGIVTQGNAGTAAQSWFTTPTIGGAVNSAGNPLFVQNTAGAAVMGAVTQSGTWNVGQTGSPWGVNVTQFGGAPVVTTAAGIPQVGLTGNAGNVLDFAGQNATSAPNSVLTGCQFNTTPTTLTNGHASPCQLDNAANVLVRVNAPLPAGTNAFGAITNTSFTNPAIGTIAAAVPTSGQYIAGVNGSGNLQGISTDNAGNVNMNLVNGGVPGYNPGDVSDANGHTIYVQGAPAGNNLPVSIATPLGTGTSPANAVAVDIISGSISAATGFNAAVTGTPFTATTGGVTSASFTPSTEVVVSNVGTTNAAYCAPGGSATTSSQYIAPGSWFAFYAAGNISQITCATSVSTTTINIIAGSGLPTGTSSGAGAVTSTSIQGNAGTVGQAWFSTLAIGGALDSATNGIYSNLLQGNAVLSPTNPAFVQETRNYFFNVAASTLTRIANTTAYTGAGQTVCLFTSVTVCAPITASIGLTNQGKGQITAVKMVKSGSGTAGASFLIHMFSAAPTTTNQFDATPYIAPFNADIPNYIGSAACSSPTPTNDGTPKVSYSCTVGCQSCSQGLTFQTLSGSTNIDMLLEVVGAYTPASGETYNIYLTGNY